MLLIVIITNSLQSTKHHYYFIMVISVIINWRLSSFRKCVLLSGSLPNSICLMNLYLYAASGENRQTIAFFVGFFQVAVFVTFILFSD